jgi:archaellum component FlaF (FlaF/FlaG flagellin family)
MVPLFVIVPLDPTVTAYADGMVTVIELGMTTLSDGPGIVPPHVAESFQIPLDTAVIEVPTDITETELEP